MLPPRRAPPGSYALQPASRSPRSRAPKVVLSFILIVMLAGAGFAVLTVMTWGSHHSQTEYSFASPSTNSSTWNIEVDTAKLSVVYSDAVDAHLAKIIVAYSWAGAFMAGKTPIDIYNVTWDETGTFILDRIDWLPFAMFDNTSVTVTLREGVEYTLNLSASIGSISLVVPDNQVLGPLNVDTSTGSTNVILGHNNSVLGDITVESSTGSTSVVINDGSRVTGMLDVSASTGSCFLMVGSANITQGISTSASTGSVQVRLLGSILGGNLTVASSTGSVEATLENTVLLRDVNIDISVSTGSIKLNITQNVDPMANLTGTLNTSTGSIDIEFSGSSSFVNAQFSTSQSFGSPGFTNLGGFQETGSAFQSTSTNASSTFSIVASVAAGDIEITGFMI